MHSTTKTPSRHAFRIPWFNRAPAITVLVPNATRDHRWPGGPPGAATDPGQFITEFFTQLTNLNRVNIADEQDRRDRLGILLDRSLDLKIIGDFVLASSKSARTWQERRIFDHDLRNYLIDRICAGIGSFSPRHLRVIDRYQDGVATIVVTELTCSVSALHLQWIVVAKPGGWRLCDVVIEEINLATLLRKKLNGLLGHDGFGLVRT